MRVVYDTNVLATILSSRSEILRLKQSVLSKEITLITSPFILSELDTVLTSKFNLTKQGAKSRTHLLARISEVVMPLTIEKIGRDPDDDNILAAAVTGNAAYILTLDKDLLILKKYQETIILTPTAFRKLT